MGGEGGLGVKDDQGEDNGKYLDSQRDMSRTMKEYEVNPVLQIYKPGG